MSHLYDFLGRNKEEILALTAKKSLDLTGARTSSAQLKEALPLFFQQLLVVLTMERPVVASISIPSVTRKANEADEEAMAIAAGRPEEAEVAKTAAKHGAEMLRLGYTLSHVVHSYGAICQAITELAIQKNFRITASEFRDLNQCLDVAIAGAVTQYQKIFDLKETNRENLHLGFLTHELRNALTNATIALQLIKKGTVGLTGSTGQVLDRSLKRMQELIDHSLTDIRLRVDPELHIKTANLLLIVDQIIITAGIEAQTRNQIIELDIDPNIIIKADQQTLYSALSNLIQNALKFTRDGGKIQVRAKRVKETIIIEIEDECGGIKTEIAEDLFKAFEQKNENRKGLGLGLSIAQRSIALNKGTITIKNLPKQGCIFTITLPQST